MFSIRIAISPSGDIHLGNSYIILINYFLKIKISSFFFLRIDDTNQKKNKLINKFFIIKKLKKMGIFLKNILKQLNFLNFYKKKIFFCKKNSYKKKYFNNKIKKKNLSFSFFIIINNCNIKFFDNNYGALNYKIFFEKNIILKKNNIPIYNYSTIIDDYFNNIFIILRGKEWLNQIPIQLIIMNKFKFLFQFNHLPNIIFYNGKKISKRNIKKNFFFNIFFFLKKIRNVFKTNKNFKFLILKKKKKITKKINNFILINLIHIIKKINVFFLINFLKIKILYLKFLKFNLNISNLNFLNKIFKDINIFFFKNKISFIIQKIKKNEFI